MRINEKFSCCVSNETLKGQKDKKPPLKIVGRESEPFYLCHRIKMLLNSGVSYHPELSTHPDVVHLCTTLRLG